MGGKVYAVVERVPFEGEEVRNVYLTREHADQFIANRKYRKSDGANLLRVVEWKVKG